MTAIVGALREWFYADGHTAFHFQIGRLVANGLPGTWGLGTTAVDCAKTRPDCQNSSELTLKH